MNEFNIMNYIDYVGLIEAAINKNIFFIFARFNFLACLIV